MARESRCAGFLLHARVIQSDGGIKRLTTWTCADNVFVFVATAIVRTLRTWSRESAVLERCR